MLFVGVHKPVQFDRYVTYFGAALDLNQQSLLQSEEEPLLMRQTCDSNGKESCSSSKRAPASVNAELEACGSMFAHLFCTGDQRKARELCRSWTMCRLNTYTMKTTVEKNMMFQNKNTVIRSFKVTWEKDCRTKALKKQAPWAWEKRSTN